MANQYTNITPEQRFWAKVDVRGTDECWPWTGIVDKDGYGFLTIGGRGKARKYGAHRLAYILKRGEVPPGLVVMHKCDNPPCCNPNHLRVGTQAENRLDTVSKGRQPRGDNHWMKRNPEKILRGDDSFSRKHPERIARGERCKQSRFTAEMVKELRARHAAGGTSYAKLAKEVGVSKRTLERMVKRVTWAHIP